VTSQQWSCGDMKASLTIQHRICTKVVRVRAMVTSRLIKVRVRTRITVIFVSVFREIAPIVTSVIYFTVAPYFVRHYSSHTALVLHYI
jgi:hypothetical protein